MSDQWRNLFDQARHENGLGNREHAERLVSLAMKEAEDLPDNCESYSSAQVSFALWCHFHERFAEAELYQKRYIEAEQRLGIGNSELANLWMFLAEIQRKQGKLGAAKETMDQAIKTYPPDYLPELSQAYADIAGVYSDLGTPSAASEAMKKSEELRKEWDQLVARRRKAQENEMHEDQL